MVATKKLTWEDYRQFPDDGNRYEIIDGEVFVSPSPFLVHQTVVGNVFFALTAHVREGNRGIVVVAPSDVLLGEHDIVQPDVFFIAQERRIQTVAGGRVHGAPDLCIEVASDSTRRTDRIGKFRQYARFGVTEYWIIDPQPRTIEAFALETDAYRSLGIVTGDERIPSRVLPALVLTAAEVFADV